MKTLIVAAIRCSLGFLLPTIVYAISAQCGLDPLPGNGTLQKIIVERGNATMEIDLNRLNGINSTREKVETLLLRQRPIRFSRFWFLTMRCAVLRWIPWIDSAK